MARRRVLRMVPGLGLAAAAAAALGLAGCDAGSSSAGKPGSAGSFNSLDVSGANYAKDFSLADMHGQRRTLADFRGKAILVFFGFTQCPDVCPTALASHGVGEDELIPGLAGHAGAAAFIGRTLDPAWRTLSF